MNYRSLLLFVLFLPLLSNAQDRLNSVKSPTSPASSILGLQPASILSPKSYQALEIGFYSNNAVIVNDFALEFTPYWAKNHSLSLDEYLYPKRAVDQLIRNSSFSIASTPNFLLGDSTATGGIGFGYRTTFYFGNKRDRQELESYKTNIRQTQKIQTRIISKAEELIENGEVIDKNEFLDKMKGSVILALFYTGSFQDISEAEEVTNNIYKDAVFLPQLNINDPDPFLDSFYALVDKHLQAGSLFNRFKSYIRDRHGFSVDVAYASLFNFPTNDFTFSVIPRHSVWVTPTYRFLDYFDFLKVMGVLRFEWYKSDYFRTYFPGMPVFDRNLDYGVGVFSELDKFSFQAELVGRSSNADIEVGSDENGNRLFIKETGSDLQYIATFNYSITDHIMVSYSIGNRFAPIQNPSNTLVSLLSLNFGFGGPTTKDLNLDR